MRIVHLLASGLLLFQAFFIFVPMAVLGAAIDWPASLDFPPAQTLPLIHDEIASVRLGYGLYLGWSLVFAASAALVVGYGRRGRPLGELAVLAIAFGVASALARAIGIVRWLTGSSALGSAYASAPDGSADRAVIETTQLALNAYGGSIGEDLGVSIFASLWLVCAGAVILHERGLPGWLGWAAFPVAAVAAMPALSIVGVNSPVDVVIATSAMLLWIAAAGIVVLLRAFRRPAATV